MYPARRMSPDAVLYIAVFNILFPCLVVLYIIQLENLLFAFNICRFVKSNAIVLCNNYSTIGIGAGQPSRLDSCKIAIKKAKQFQSSKIKNSIAASDAFFPFVDGVKIGLSNF